MFKYTKQLVFFLLVVIVAIIFVRSCALHNQQTEPTLTVSNLQNLVGTRISLTGTPTRNASGISFLVTPGVSFLVDRDWTPDELRLNEVSVAGLVEAKKFVQQLDDGTDVVIESLPQSHPNGMISIRGYSYFALRLDP